MLIIFSYYFNRGINITKLQGLVLLLSWWLIISFHAVLQASTEPGNTNTKVLFATPARALDCNDDVFIFSKDFNLNNSPNPSITLSRRGSIASGVPS